MLSDFNSLFEGLVAVDPLLPTDLHVLLFLHNELVEESGVREGLLPQCYFFESGVDFVYLNYVFANCIKIFNQFAPLISYQLLRCGQLAIEFLEHVFQSIAFYPFIPSIRESLDSSVVVVDVPLAFFRALCTIPTDHDRTILFVIIITKGTICMAIHVAILALGVIGAYSFDSLLLFCHFHLHIFAFVDVSLVFCYLDH